MDKIFLEIECLTEQSKQLNAEYLRKNWFKKADKRYISQYLQKFVEYNKKYFDFLGVTSIIKGTDQRVSLKFKSSEFIGVIPLRSPDTGKQIGDFIVSPRYSSKDKLLEYIKILNLTNKAVNTEFKQSIPLISGRNFQPPFYYEAVIFIKKIEKLIRKRWLKFDQTEKNIKTPQGQVNWDKYIHNEFKVENRLKFPVRKNILSEFHTEYSNLKFVFDLCKNELLSPSTPEEIKLALKPKLFFIQEKLCFHKSIETEKMQIRQSDPILIKEIKIQANKLLQKEFSKSIAWRVDFNDVFEKYIQYLFEQVSKEFGGKFYSNFKIHRANYPKYAWELKYLEPDGVFRKGNTFTVFVDAKYKSHLLNKFSQSEELKNEYRKDLHQIISYTSFSDKDTKYGFLCYPSNVVESKEIKFKNSLNHNETIVSLLGIPLDTNVILNVKELIFEKLNLIEKTVQNNVYKVLENKWLS